MVVLSHFDGIYNNKRVLVTGDSGFKGSWLTFWLHEMGADVYGYSLPPKTAEDNFVKMGLENKIIHEDGDIRDRNHIIDFVNKVRPEICFHLAAQPIVLDSYNNPHETFETNIMGTVNLFDSLRQVGSIKAIINVTSDKCYKNQSEVKSLNETDELGGSDPYSSSKGCSELVTYSYSKSFFNESEILVATARAGNVIGGGDWADFRLIPDIFRSLFNNSDFTIRNPDFVRPWQFVLEPLRGYLALGQKLLLGLDDFVGAWNFGPDFGEDFTVNEVVEQIIKNLGSKKLKIIHSSGSELHESKFLSLDISKSREFLNWFPILDFSTTVSLTTEGYLQQDSYNLYEDRLNQLDNYISMIGEHVS